MVLHGTLEHVGRMDGRSGHVRIDRVVIGGQVIHHLRVPHCLKACLDVGDDMELYVHKLLGASFLLGVAQEYGVKTISIAPIFIAAFLALFSCIAFCLWAVFEAWAYWIGIPLAFVTYYLFSLCIGLIYFGY